MKRPIIEANELGWYYLRSLAFVVVAMIVLTTASCVVNAAPISRDEFREMKEIVRQVQLNNDYMYDWQQWPDQTPEYAQDVRITGKGDCEDFALGYYNAILERFPHHRENLKLMQVMARNWGTDRDALHAVLFINYRGRTHVADTVGTRPDGTKMLVSVKDLRATQYAPKKVVGEFVYPTPTRFLVFNRHVRTYERGW
jgi:hypothetical protein